MSFQDTLKRSFSPKNNLRSIFFRTGARLDPLDGIRALAILWIIVFHGLYGVGLFLSEPALGQMMDSIPWYMQWMTKGENAVDLFFVLSGFLVGGALIREWQDTGGINLRQFYARRFFRIVPIYWLTLFFFAIGLVLVGKFELSRFLVNLFYLNNFFPQEWSYLNWSWSLCIEEQFYMLFPLVVLFLFRSIRQAFHVIIMLFVASIVIRGLVILQNPQLLETAMSDTLFRHSETYDPLYFDSLYTNIYTRFGSLIAGVLAGYCWVVKPGWWVRIASNAVINNSLLIACIAVLCWSHLIPIYTTNAIAPGNELFVYHWLYRSMNTLLFACVMLLALYPVGLSRVISGFLSHKIWFPVAQVSYSLYLFHIPFLVLAASLLMGLNVINKEALTMQDSFPIAVLGFAMAFLFSILTFVFVEKPFINIRPKFESARKVPPTSQSLSQP
ncbi:MAG: acyltransferase [Ketobacteraceae bacterium]|nr:acyltransferase [Ketobacteraceae bacterium]